VKMSNNDRREKLDCLLEEYKQIWELYRHQDTIASNKEAIFAVAAFGILALVVSKEFLSEYVVGAAVVSIALYLFHLLSFDRMNYFKEMSLEGIRKSEKKINDMISGKKQNEKCLDFQTDCAVYKMYVKVKWRERFGVRKMQWCMLLLLIIVWGIILF